MSFQLFAPSPIVSFLCFLLVVSVNIQLCLGNAEMFEACKTPFRCGHTTAGYPFWGDGLPVYCDPIPGFELNCENENITLMIKEVKYVVLSIDEKSHVLNIARKDIYDNGICHSNVSNLPNTSFSEHFEILEGYKMLTLRCGFENGGGEFTCSSETIIDKDHDTITIGGLGLPRYVSVIVTLPEKFSAGALEKTLSYLEEHLKHGFQVKWKVKGLEFCDKCLQSSGRCGYPVLRSPSCYCIDGPFDPFTEPPCSTAAADVSSEKKSFFNKPRKIAVGIIASIVGIIIILSMVGMGRLWKKKTEDDQSMEAFIRNCGSHAPRRYSFSDVRNITKSFSEKLGQGAYGNVYKGKLPDGRLVAVKILKEFKGNGEDFINEVASMSRTSHVNIVSLLGFCCERNKRVLIYEFMCNRSLDKFTCDTESSTTNCNLEWKTLYQIAIGIARGLEYLHKGCNIRIVHFDIKPHNILLDEDFCPKISDFGLAKQSNQKDSIMSMLHIRGTVGYIAPEMFYRKFGGVSYKSDVYSYGMMILEIVGARKNIGIRVSQTSEIYFPDSIYNLLELGKDFDLPSVVTEEEKEIAKRMILVSLWCIQTNPSDRPSMTKVVEMLEGRPKKLQIPPKPYWSSPPRSPKLSLPTSVSTQLASECEKL